MAFTVLGILFIMLFGVEIAYQEFFPAQDPELDGHPVRINNSEIIPVVRFLMINGSLKTESLYSLYSAVSILDRIVGPFDRRRIGRNS